MAFSSSRASRASPFCSHFFDQLPNMKIGLALLGLAATASAIELTPDNWDTETSGKTVFIKFLAPW